MKFKYIFLIVKKSVSATYTFKDVIEKLFLVLIYQQLLTESSRNSTTVFSILSIFFKNDDDAVNRD